MIHAKAAEIAIKVHDELKPFCDKICIAGSVRRGKPEVHDIELVMQPKVNPNPGVFESVHPLLDYLNMPAGYLKAAQRLKGANRMQQWQLPGIVCELYIVLPPAEYGVILTLRTGPAELSKLFVTQKKYGGLLPSNARVKDGAVWVNHQIEPMPTEEQFFSFCGLRFIPPDKREVLFAKYYHVPG